MRIEGELESSDAGIPPAYWPSSGALTVENLSARYSDGEESSPLLWPSSYSNRLLDSQYILHDLTFEVRSGERVGVGKSTKQWSNF